MVGNAKCIFSFPHNNSPHKRLRVAELTHRYRMTYFCVSMLGHHSAPSHNRNQCSMVTDDLSFWVQKHQAMRSPINMHQGGSGPRFNIKLSYRYSISQCVDKTVVRWFCLHHSNSYNGKTAYLYWIGPGSHHSVLSGDLVSINFTYVFQGSFKVPVE